MKFPQSGQTSSKVQLYGVPANMLCKAGQGDASDFSPGTDHRAKESQHASLPVLYDKPRSSFVFKLIETMEFTYVSFFNN